MVKKNWIQGIWIMGFLHKFCYKGEQKNGAEAILEWEVKRLSFDRKYYKITFS